MNPISFVMCTYGRSHCLCEAMECYYLSRESIYDELIVLNDFPSQTLYVDDISNVVRIINAKRRFDSLGQKRMAAALTAKNETVLFVDDDDIFLPHYSHALRTACDPLSSPSVWSFNHWACSGIGDKITLDFKEFPVPGSFITTKTALLECGGFPAIANGEDQVLRGRLYDTTGVKLLSSDVPPGYLYRWNNGVYHLSGSSENEAWPGADKDLSRRVEIKEEPIGEIKIDPRWFCDYQALHDRCLRDYYANK